MHLSQLWKVWSWTSPCILTFAHFCSLQHLEIFSGEGRLCLDLWRGVWSAVWRGHFPGTHRPGVQTPWISCPTPRGCRPGCLPRCRRTGEGVTPERRWLGIWGWALWAGRPASRTQDTRVTKGNIRKSRGGFDRHRDVFNFTVNQSASLVVTPHLFVFSDVFFCLHYRGAVIHSVRCVLVFLFRLQSKRESRHRVKVWNRK